MSSADGGLIWSDAVEMSPFETMMWRAEADPALRSTIMSLQLLDTAPDWDRLVEAHDWATRMAPRFRKRVVEPPLELGTPCWTVDTDFDLGYHVRRTRLPADGERSEERAWAGVLDVAARMAMTPFDRTRPPWEALLIEGLPGGRTVYALKLHHSTTDGLGGIQLFSGLFRRGRAHDAAKPQPLVPHEQELTGLQVLGRQISSDVRAVGGAVSGAGRLVGGVLRDPVGTVRDAVRYSTSLSRVLADPDAPGSPLLAPRSHSWRFGALDVAFADLRAAGKAAGRSVNDAFVAALLGGFRRYHEEMGRPVDAIPMAIPVSVRAAGDAEGGNRIASLRMSGPVSVADPVKRMAMVADLVHQGREEPAADNVSAVAPALARLPGPVLALVAGGVTKGNDLQASNVPGISEDVYLAGARVERMYPYAPRPGCAAMISMVTHGAVCCVGANLDPVAITEHELFVRCLADGFSEVLGPDAAAPVVRG